MSASRRLDPFLSFSFEVKVEGIIAGSFSEVSGIGAEVEVEDLREGGINDFVHKLPRVARYGNLALRTGLTDSTVLYDWYKDVVRGKIERRQVTVTETDSQKTPLKSWSFKNAFPIKWNGPELKADSNTVAVEAVELVHQGLVWL